MTIYAFPFSVPAEVQILSLTSSYLPASPQPFKMWGSRWCTEVKIPAKGTINQSIKGRFCRVCAHLSVCAIMSEQNKQCCSVSVYLNVPKFWRWYNIAGTGLVAEKRSAESSWIILAYCEATAFHQFCPITWLRLEVWFCDKNLHSTKTNTNLCFPQYESLHAYVADIYTYLVLASTSSGKIVFQRALTIHLNSLVTAQPGLTAVYTSCWGGPLRGKITGREMI